MARAVGDEEAVGASVGEGSEAVGASVGPFVGVSVLGVSSVAGAMEDFLLGVSVGLALWVIQMASLLDFQ